MRWENELMSMRKGLLVMVIVMTSLVFGSCEEVIGVERTEEVASLIIEERLAGGANSSGSVAIMDGGRIVYQDAFGKADREENIDADDETVYNIGSVSKLFVTVSVLMLVDEGKVELDEPVTTYLPDFVMADDRYLDITVHMLLNHSSGLPGFTVWNNLAHAYNEEVYDELYDALAQSTLKHDPGELMTYCNDGFTLAELVVAEVSGMEFSDFLMTRIFEPLGMNSSGFGLGRMDDVSNPAYYYRMSGEKEPLEVVSMLASGGISSTPSELCLFTEIFNGNSDLLSEEAVELMLDMQTSDFLEELDGDGFAFGLGWDFAGIPIFSDPDILIYGKSGGTAHYESMVYTVPSIGVSVAFTGCGTSFGAVGIAFEILETYLEEQGFIVIDDEQPSFDEPQPIDPEMYAYAGFYTTGEQLIEIEFDEDDRMYFGIYQDGERVTRIEAVTYDDYFVVGSTTFYFRTVAETSYLMQYMFGGVADVMEMPAAEKVLDIENAMTLDLPEDDVLWLRVDSHPMEATAILETHIQQLSYNEHLPGYVNFHGIKRIDSSTEAGMAAKAIRDLTEMKLVDQGGDYWIWLSGALYMPGRLASNMTVETAEVAIGDEGYVEWFVASEDLDVTFTWPSDGRIIVYGQEGILYDNLYHDDSVFIPAGSLIEFLGNEGDVFGVE
jgi:CubicO group peptidase (beta-lactamase class C family)